MRERNRAATLECCAETGIEISDHLVQASGENVAEGLKLLEIIGLANSTYQMRPVFVPLRDGKVIECQVINGRDTFRALDGTLPPSKSGASGAKLKASDSDPTSPRAQTFASNLGWSASVKVEDDDGSFSKQRQTVAGI